MKKKYWTTPELVVLVKGQPEENILTACKAVHGYAYPVPLGYEGQICKNWKSKTCGACQSEGGGGS